MSRYLSSNASSQWMTYWDDEVRHQQVVLFLLTLPPWAAGPEADGLVVCGSSLDFLTPFFAEFPTSAHGLAFLFNDDENLTLLGSTLGAVTDNATNRPYTVWSHPTTTYRDTARAWLANTGGAREKASFTAREAMYDVAKVAQTAGGTSDAVWWIALVSPVKGFTGNVLEQNDIEMANNRNLVLIVSATVLAGLAVLVVLIVLSSNAIVRQIGRINQHLECVSKMDFDNGIPEFRSIVSEIKDMANQTSKMTIALQTFNVYVPSAIVHWLVANSIPPVISVTSTAATVLFLDVVNFTGMMESVGANTMIGILGTMFEDFSATLTRNKGVIDKYIGDAIMAFWNAPIPVADHSLMACQSAVEILEALDRMNAETFRPEMGMNMGVRIGISSGVVQAGNIGSSSRMNYTVLGDSVNLAARLEPLNKDLHTSVCVNDQVRFNCGNKAVFRCIGRVPCKGFKELIRVHELLGLPDRLSASARGLMQDYFAIDEAIMGNILNTENLMAYIKDHPEDLGPACAVKMATRSSVY